MIAMNDFLYSLLPAFMRQRDENGSLRALMAVLEDQCRRLEGGSGDGRSCGVADLYEDLFIETCDAAVVAQLASLVEEKGIRAGATFANGRAFVANAIAFRRRKGTAAILPRLIYAATGWIAVVRDIGEENIENATLVKCGGKGHAIDVPTITQPTSPSSTNAINVYVWRHQIGSFTETLKNNDGLYISTNSAGFYNVPQPLPLAARPPIECLPVKLTEEWLRRDFKEYHDKWGRDGNGPPETIFYGDGRALSLWADGKLVHPSRITMTLNNDINTDKLKVTVSGDVSGSLKLIYGTVSAIKTNNEDKRRLMDLLKIFLPVGIEKKTSVIFLNQNDIAITQPA